MDIPLLIALATLLWQVIDFLREVANFKAQRSAVVTQVTAWVGGVAVVLIAAHAALFDGFLINGVALSSLDIGSQIFLGLVISSFASSLVDVKQALDNTDTSTKPPLVSSAVAPGVDPGA